MRQQQDERDLIGRMRARDGSAVADLAATYGPRIQQLAFRYLKNWEDAEEVAQDVLMKVYRKIDAFRGDAALSSWIYRITFNTAMSRLRTARFSRPRRGARAGVSKPSRRSTLTGRAGRLGVACRRPGDARGNAQEADRRADPPAHGLPGSGVAARHSGARRPKRRAPCCASSRRR